MVGRKRKLNGQEKSGKGHGNMMHPEFDPDIPVEQYIGQVDPRQPHPGDIDQPVDHHFDEKELGERREGENFDKFEVDEEMRRRGSATCNSVMLVKHRKPLPMWFDEFLCPRVMPGKWCGYCSYAFRRRIRFGSWPQWKDVPEDVKDDAWDDILASWDFRTKLSAKDHIQLKKQWTSYACNKMRNWRTKVAKRYIWKPVPGIGHPCLKYRWMDKKEWGLFESYRRSAAFAVKRESATVNGEKKIYKHHTGSGGYRVIYIQKAKEMREEAIKEKMDKGMIQQEAEVLVSRLYFRADRSIIFLEANKRKKDNKYSEDHVARLEDKILKLNKEKKEGKLKVDGRADILVIATEKGDHGGRWRGCSTIAKIKEALPDYTAAKSRKKGSRRSSNPPTQSIPEYLDEKDSRKLDLATLESYTGWICKKLGVEKPVDIKPQDFIGQSSNVFSSNQGKVKVSTSSSDPNGGDSEGKEEIPCFLLVRNDSGEVVTASAGMVINRSANLPLLPLTECVRICSPIMRPNAPIPIYSPQYPSVGTAIGVPLNWPEEFIDYRYRRAEEAPPKKVQSDSTDDTQDTDDEFSSIDPRLCTAGLNVNLEFAHHTRDKDSRADFFKFVREMITHPNGRDTFLIPCDEYLFGPRSQFIVLEVLQNRDWISRLNNPMSKKWIMGHQMDMWASFMRSQMAKEDYGRIHFINTNTSFSSFRTDDEAKSKVVSSLMEIMTAHNARLYVMPICRNFHWTMLFIVPELSVVYCIDSAQQAIYPHTRKFEYDLLMSFGAAYEANIRNLHYGHQSITNWTIENITHKVQLGGWECGYYCMLYMEKIALLHDGINVHKLFPEDQDAYPIEIVEGLIDTFCRRIVHEIAPICRDQCNNARI